MKSFGVLYFPSCSLSKQIKEVVQNKDDSISMLRNISVIVSSSFTMHIFCANFKSFVLVLFRIQLRYSVKPKFTNFYQNTVHTQLSS